MEAGPHSVLTVQGRGVGNLAQLEADWWLQFGFSLLAPRLFSQVRAVFLCCQQLVPREHLHEVWGAAPGHQSLQASSTWLRPAANTAPRQAPNEVIGRSQPTSPSPGRRLRSAGVCCHLREAAAPSIAVTRGPGCVSKVPFCSGCS